MAPKRVLTTIRYSVPGTQPPIYLAGSFSNPEWWPAEMPYTTDENNEHEFYKEVEVEEEREYQYKFRIGMGDWWILNEGSPTATDNAGNRNNIISIPRQEEAEEEISKTPKPSSFLPLVHEASPAKETPVRLSKSDAESKDNPTSLHTYLKQHDGSVDDNGDIRIDLPTGIETPTSVPKSGDIGQRGLSPERGAVTGKGPNTGDEPVEDAEQPLGREFAKEGRPEIQDEWFGQKSDTDAPRLNEKDPSENVASSSTTHQLQDEYKNLSRPSTSSTTSDPVNHSDHTDESFVLVPQHDTAEDKETTEEVQSETKGSDIYPTSIGDEHEAIISDLVEPQAAKLEKVESENSTAEAKSKPSREVDTGAASAEDFDSTSEAISNSEAEIDNPFPEQDISQVTDNPVKSETSKIVIALQQSFDGTASPTSVRTIGRDAKSKNILKDFLHLVFVEWIGKLFGKLWSGFKRQSPNE